MGGPGSERVAAYYDGFDEWGRLETPAGRIEFERTLACLARLPSGSRVLDLGGGPGRYTIELARQGHTVVLADLSERQLDLARRGIERAGVADRVERVLRLHAADLSPLEAGSFDAALALGPFYHLTDAAERERAARELARVVRPGGLAFVAFLPRLVGLAGLLLRAAADPEQVTPAVLERAARDGVFENATARGFQEGWYAEPEEIERLLAATGFARLDLVSLRGLTVEREQALLDLRDRAPETARAFEAVHAATMRDPSVIRLGGHALLVLERVTGR